MPLSRILRFTQLVHAQCTQKYKYACAHMCTTNRIECMCLERLLCVWYNVKMHQPMCNSTVMMSQQYHARTVELHFGRFWDAGQRRRDANMHSEQRIQRILYLHVHLCFSLSRPSRCFQNKHTPPLLHYTDFILPEFIWIPYDIPSLVWFVYYFHA